MQNSIKSLATGALFSAIASVSHADKLVYEPQVIDVNSLEVKALCAKANKKVGILIGKEQLCEISTDGGKTWKILAGGAGGILGGLAVAAFIRLRKKKPDDASAADLELDDNALDNFDWNNLPQQDRDSSDADSLLDIGNFDQEVIENTQSISNGTTIVVQSVIQKSQESHVNIDSSGDPDLGSVGVRISSEAISPEISLPIIAEEVEGENKQEGMTSNVLLNTDQSDATLVQETISILDKSNYWNTRKKLSRISQDDLDSFFMPDGYVDKFKSLRLPAVFPEYLSPEKIKNLPFPSIEIFKKSTQDGKIEFHYKIKTTDNAHNGKIVVKEEIIASSEMIDLVNRYIDDHNMNISNKN